MLLPICKHGGFGEAFLKNISDCNYNYLGSKFTAQWYFYLPSSKF